MTTGHEISTGEGVSHGHTCLPVRCQVLSRRGSEGPDKGQVVGALRVLGSLGSSQSSVGWSLPARATVRRIHSEPMHPDRTPGGGDVPETGGDHQQLQMLPITGRST